MHSKRFTLTFGAGLTNFSGLMKQVMAGAALQRAAGLADKLPLPAKQPLARQLGRQKKFVRPGAFCKILIKIK